jgi:hypothetical protein
MTEVKSAAQSPARESTHVVHPGPQDPRIIAKVVPGTISRATTTSVTTHSFLVVPQDGFEKMLSVPEVYTTAYKYQQDVVDAVLFHLSPDGKQTHLLCSRCCWPTLTARSQLGAPTHPAEAEGMLIGLPGAFATRSIHDTLRSIASNRLGVELKDSPFILGGASVVLPNSPEAAFPRAQEVIPPSPGRLAVIGTNFAGSRETLSLSLQEIVNRSLNPHNPDLFCMRLLERALRLAEVKGEEVHLPSHLSLANGHVYERNQVSKDLPILSKAELQSILSGERKIANVVTSLTIEEVRNPPNPFLQGYTLPVTTVSETGSALHSFNAELVARSNVDCVASIGWCRIKDESGAIQPYLVANIGARVALASRFRENHAHPIAFATHERHVEIVTGSVGTARTPGELEARAISALTFETGLTAHRDSVSPVMRGFRSPGFSPDADHVFLMEVDPTTITSDRKGNQVNYSFLIKASDVRDMICSGQCSDLLLGLAAGIVERAESSTVPVRGAALLSKAGRALAEISGEASEGHQLIEENVPALFASPSLRNQIRGMLEREGQSPTDVTHPSETIFFSPLLPESPRPLRGKGTILDLPGFALLMDHDDRHFYYGEFIPFVVDASGKVLVGSDGKPVMHSIGTNREMLMTNEAYALFGDADTARKIGIELYESLSGEPSAARIFDAVRNSNPGFTSEHELSAFCTMVVKGQIPESILKHPDYQAWRAVIRSKLLGYYVRDRPNSDLMYHFWKEHPEVAQAALDFCPRASADPSIFRKRFDELTALGAELSEGFNPFKAKLERLWRSEIPRQALNLALLKSYALNNKLPGSESYIAAVDEHLRTLLSASKSLERTLEGIHNMEPTRRNLAGAELYLTLTEELLPEVSLSYRKLSQDSDILTPDQIEERRDKKYFLTKVPEFHTSGEMERLIEAIEFKNFDEAGLPRPPSLCAPAS